MATGKFSAQMQQNAPQQRLTRTQRKIISQQQSDEQRSFDALQQQARELQDTEFKDIPFEEYQRKYAMLSPELRQFFKSPQQILQDQETQKQEEREILQRRVEQNQQAMSSLQRSLQEYKDYANRQSPEWWQRNQDSFYKNVQTRQAEIDRYQDIVNYSQAEAGKINEGASASDVLTYAQNLASYNQTSREERDKSVSSFNKSLASGELNQNLEKLGYSIEWKGRNLTYDQYIKSVEQYNINVAGKERQAKYDAEAWQKANPKEVLIYDKSGKAIAIQSDVYKTTLTLEKYNEKIASDNAIIEADKKRQAEQLNQSISILEKSKYGQDFSTKTPDANLWQKIWKGFDTAYYSAPFISYSYGGVPESKQREMAILREQRTKESVKPIFTPFGFFVPLQKFNTIPLSKSTETIEYKRQMDYKQGQIVKALDELDRITKESPPELKPIIQEQGIKILEGKGVEMKRETTMQLPMSEVKKQFISPNTKDQFIKTAEGEQVTTTTITDPAMERRISQNLLEWDIESSEKDIKGQVLVATRWASTEALKTYGIYKGVGYALKGVGYAWNSLGGGLKLESATRTGMFSGTGVISSSGKLLPEYLTTKTIILAEGYAKVPRDWVRYTKTLAGISLTGLYAYERQRTYQYYTQTSEYGKGAFFIETAGQLAGIELTSGIGKKTYDRVMNRYENFRLKTIKQADISQKGFKRYNKLLGYEETVYMNRYEGIKLRKPSSWYQALKGTPKGAFTGRVYKFIPDEVLAYYKYGGDFTLYDKKGNPVDNWIDIIEFLSKSGRVGKISDVKLVGGTPKEIKKINAEAFPYDARKSHIKWFLKKNIAEYGLPQKYKLPIDVKGKAFGYSATGEAWVGVDFKANKIFYFDRGLMKTLKVKGAIQYVSGKGVSAGFLRIFSKGAEESAVGKSATSPIIYADYFDRYQLNRAIREIKGMDMSGRELKAYIYSKDTGSSGTLNIGGHKREVEGTVEIETRVPIRKKYAIKLEGWKVPIEEQVFKPKIEMTSKELKAIMKEVGSVKEFKGIAMSSLPSRASSLSPIYSPSSTYSQSSRAVSKSYSNVSRASSQTSRASYSGSLAVSRIISKISRTSAPSSFSYSPRSSSVSSAVSRAISTSRSPKSSRVSSIISSNNSQLKRLLRQKFKKTPENFGLFPDFTARAVGLAPMKVKSEKQALKEMLKIQSGFEIRTGAKLWNK